MKHGFAVRMVLLFAMMSILLWMPGMAQKQCVTQSFDVIMATPFSSRINREGDALQAILIQPLKLNSEIVLPSGAKLKGHVAEVHSSTRKEAGTIRVQFSEVGAVHNLTVVLATQDGWLHQSDENTSVWIVSANRSTRLLNMALQRRLGTNRAVWAQILGLRENVIPDPSTDEFIYRYHERDVLVGAGDRIRLKTVCAGEN